MSCKLDGWALLSPARQLLVGYVWTWGLAPSWGKRMSPWFGCLSWAWLPRRCRFLQYSWKLMLLLGGRSSNSNTTFHFHQTGCVTSFGRSPVLTVGFRCKLAGITPIGAEYLQPEPTFPLQWQWCWAKSWYAWTKAARLLPHHDTGALSRSAVEYPLRKLGNEAKWN